MTFSQKLARFHANPHALQGMGRGLEREGLRIDASGKLSAKMHPKALGSALTHKWITTDFAEQLLEFITPVSHRAEETLSQLYDIHSFTYQALDGESIWPLSMPCYVKNEEDITLAHYGSSNIGRMKTVYRQGLQNRYGGMMQVISGLHFNFSFPDVFWQQLFGDQTTQARQDAISDAYFALIRNYYRFGWMIPYLFGASPAICGSFLKKETDLGLSKLGESTYYLPYATSLRLSDLGYTSGEQSILKMGFNSVDQYLTGLRAATRLPSAEFAKIGVKNSEGYQQLNANVLQIENELYAPIRPKRVTKEGEKPSEALARAGVEYIEVRSLDVNPFSPVGIEQQQIDFLDLFLTWCVLTDSDPMTESELMCWRENWSRIILEGRKPGLALRIGCSDEVYTQAQWGLQVFAELTELAKLMDSALDTPRYVNTCEVLASWFEQPEKTYSARLLDEVIANNSIGKTGLAFAQAHAQYFTHYDYQFFTQQQFTDESAASLVRQQEVEQKDVLSFDEFLHEYFQHASPSA